MDIIKDIIIKDFVFVSDVMYYVFTDESRALRLDIEVTIGAEYPLRAVLKNSMLIVASCSNGNWYGSKIHELKKYLDYVKLNIPDKRVITYIRDNLHEYVYEYKDVITMNSWLLSKLVYVDIDKKIDVI